MIELYSGRRLKTILCCFLALVITTNVKGDTFTDFLELQTAEQKMLKTITRFYESTKKMSDKLPSFLKTTPKEYKMQREHFGSMYEQDGGCTARFFQPSKYFNKIIEADVAQRYDISKHQIKLIEDNPMRPGYVQIKINDKIIRRLLRQTRKQSINKKVSWKRFTTDNVYLNSEKIRNITNVLLLCRSNTLKLIEMTLNIAFKLKPGQTLSVKYGRHMKHTGLKTSSLLRINGRNIWKLAVKHTVMFSLNWWPEIAAEWKFRQRNWPNKNVIKNLTKISYIISKKSTSVNTELKYSFTNVEKLLSGMRSLLQNLNFFILKSIFYKYIKPIHTGFIQSYIVKTVMLWTCEQYPPSMESFWDIKNNNFNAIKYMLGKLLEVFENNVLPNYFISKINVIKHVPLNVKSKVIKKLKKIIKDFNCFLPNNTVEVQSSIQELTIYFEKLVTFSEDAITNGVMTTLLDHPNILKEATKHVLAGTTKNKLRQIKMKIFKKPTIYLKLLLAFSIILCVIYLLFIHCEKKKDK